MGEVRSDLRMQVWGRWRGRPRADAEVLFEERRGLGLMGWALVAIVPAGVAYSISIEDEPWMIALMSVVIAAMIGGPVAFAVLSRFGTVCKSVRVDADGVWVQGRWVLPAAYVGPARVLDGRDRSRAGWSPSAAWRSPMQTYGATGSKASDVPVEVEVWGRPERLVWVLGSGRPEELVAAVERLRSETSRG